MKRREGFRQGKFIINGTIRISRYLSKVYNKNLSKKIKRKEKRKENLIRKLSSLKYCSKTQKKRVFSSNRILFFPFFFLQREKLNSFSFVQSPFNNLRNFVSVSKSRKTKNGRFSHLWSTDPWAKAPPHPWTCSSVIAVNEPAINLCLCNPNISESISIGKQLRASGNGAFRFWPTADAMAPGRLQWREGGEGVN